MAFIPKRFDNAEPVQFLERLRGPQVLIQRTYLVDEPNKLYFVDLGQASPARDENPPAYFNLLSGEHTITIEARPHFTEENGTDILRFDIARIGIPEALSCNLELLRETIEDAVAVYWSALFRSPIPARVTMPAAIDRI